MRQQHGTAWNKYPRQNEEDHNRQQPKQTNRDALWSAGNVVSVTRTSMRSCSGNVRARCGAPAIRSPRERGKPSVGDRRPKVVPVSGGTSRFPHYAFGSLAGATFGWFSYIGLDVARAIERVSAYAGAMLAQAGLSECCELVEYEPAPEVVAESPRPSSQVENGRPGRPSRMARAQPVEARLDAEPAASSRARQTSSPVSENGSFDFVGIVMAKSAEGDAVAGFLSRRPGIEVREQPSFWDIRARDRLVIPYDQISEELGYEIDAYSIQHEMSTHYGRMVATDDALMLFSDPTEAMEHLLS
jgi:propane monooxygenase coupling protein